MLGLPKKNSTKVVNVNDIVKVSLRNDGKLFVDDQEVEIDEIEEDIEVLLDSSPNLTFLLKIEPEVPYQLVVQVIEIVRKLEVDNFSFSMTEPG